MMRNGARVLGPRRERRRLVILGAGFAGLHTAKFMEKWVKPSDNLDIVLVNDKNYFLYTPMLSEVAAGTVESRHILTPLRELCGRLVDFIRAEVAHIDLEAKTVTLADAWREDETRLLSYDYLVIALGSTTNRTLVPGVKRHAFTLKEISDALQIRNQVIEMFERASLEPDPAIRRAMLTFTVAGGGFSGIEVAGSLRDLADEIIGFYPHLYSDETRVVVVEAQNRILGELPEDLAQYALRALEHRSIEVHLGMLISEVTEENIRLSDGNRIPTRTVVWTTGVAMEPLLSCLPCAKDKRCRIQVDEYLEVPDYPGVLALGDCALIPDCGEPDRFAPPTAQHALREAETAANNILARVREQPERKKKFCYRSLGELVVLGHHQAVAVIQGVKFRGVLAWFLWRTVYLWKLPSLRKKIRVAMDWTIDFFAPRDTTQVRLLPTEVVEERIQELEEEVARSREESFKYRSTA